MKKLFAVLFTIGFLSSWVGADGLEPFGGVKQVTINDGDTITTSQVTCACTTGCSGGATSLSASQTPSPLTGGSRTNRRRTFVNITSTAEVFLGTATVANSLNNTGFRLDASTGTAHMFQTYSTAPFYCQTAGVSSGTITVIQETNSVN